MNFASLLHGALGVETLGPTDLRDGFLDNYPLAVEAQRQYFTGLGMPTHLVDRLAWMSVVLTTGVLGRPDDSADMACIVTATFDTESNEWCLIRDEKVFLKLKTTGQLHAGAWGRVWSEGGNLGSLRAEMDQLNHSRQDRGNFLEEILTIEYLFAVSEGAFNVFHDISVTDDVYAIQYSAHENNDDPNRYLVVTFP